MSLKRKIFLALKWFLGISQAYKKAPSFSVTVLIPAYNEEKNIAKTIRSVREQTYKVEKILVVDDSSEDETQKVAKRAGAEVIRTPKNTKNKAKAINYGLKEVKSEILICVDADTILEKNAIEEILKAFGDEKVAIASGFVLPQRVKTIFEKARLLQYLEYFFIQKETQNHWGVPLVSSGCFFAIKTEILKKMQGFCAGTIAEDMELTWRILLTGKKAVLTKAISYPLDPPNFALYYRQVSRWYRGFLQNISLHYRNLWKKPKLALAVYYYLLAGIANFVFLTGGFFLALIGFFEFFSFLKCLAFFFFLKASLLILIALVRGKKFGCQILALKSILSYFLVAPLDMYIFWQAIWSEWIRKQPLKIWEKGH